MRRRRPSRAPVEAASEREGGRKRRERAAFHAAAIARGGPDPGSSPARHAAFVAINLLCAAGFVWRPRGFTALFAALTAQQLASHGALAWRLWRDARRLDAPSLVVLVAMPALLAMLLRDRAPTAPASP